ncbi:23S rRNA pseudouridine(1911/1915/1917) synthase RluD [Chromatocurvus halotolerans]|uniref:Pseudouridine synthase n=1 Tax=Chromatocurvus halotolerans TaxID=1132028 RepID=A0A4R2KN17_9GAMM|nr:23S rRNA pseudouridine(1911/1915/1917) synthase RluD [Chromatocurvus halotolerans]TCO74854.1 ribosomal large subunit pseudouridine synthase D [Chromatocurvus halotolerans]
MIERIELSAVAEEVAAGERLDQVAARLFPDYSRSRLQAWIRDGALTVDGALLRPREKVAAGATLRISAELEDAVGWQGQPIALDIVHEDDSILVLNKPAGLVVHPAAGHHDGTLVNALINHHGAMSQLPRGGIVHRLDKDTSGIMVAAKTLQAHAHLVEQLQARTVGREYDAVCVGAMTGGATVDAPMGRHPRQRKKMAVVAQGGKNAVTHYRVAQRFAHHTHITVRLETGRTHQIRVHLSHRHYPLIGDPVYGGRPRIPAGASQSLVDALRRFPRQALHARKLRLVHPREMREMTFECPLPDDMQELLAVLATEDPVDGLVG